MGFLNPFSVLHLTPMSRKAIKLIQHSILYHQRSEHNSSPVLLGRAPTLVSIIERGRDTVFLKALWVFLIPDRKLSSTTRLLETSRPGKRAVTEPPREPRTHILFLLEAVSPSGPRPTRLVRLRV